MDCPNCGATMYTSMGGKEICPRCEYGSSSFKQVQEKRKRSKQGVSTTIVGVRPPGSDRKQGESPHGIEMLLKKASVDASFRQLLLEKRAEAAPEIGLGLTPAEATMLNSAPAEQIEMLIKNIKVPETQRQAFLGNEATVMRAAIAENCRCRSCRRITADELEGDLETTRGIRPDLPVTKGIRPDLPSERNPKSLVDELISRRTSDKKDGR